MTTFDKEGPRRPSALSLATTILMAFSVGNNFIVALAEKPGFFQWDRLFGLYGHFPEDLRLNLLEEARSMFAFGYDSYMNHAFPFDELDPINCKGRGPDLDDPSNLNINDVLGDYSLTLVDALDTLAVMGNASEFKRAVRLVVDNVSFDKPSTVQVFEANIRILGGLLSAHLLITDPDQAFGDLRPTWYSGELLTMAHDLANRLLSAFELSPTGLPYPRVHLRDGTPPEGRRDSNTAGAGSLVLEFGVLSRLLGDPVYEHVARKAVRALLGRRNNVTGLVGSNINVVTGQWIGKMAGLGAGTDSFYEYLFKSYVMFDDHSDLRAFSRLYQAAKLFMRKGRPRCNEGVGRHPFYGNVNMETGSLHNHWVDSLQAAMPALQVLNGDVDEAVCHHAYYYAIWKRFECLPERFNWNLNSADVKFYPLRPEFIESTYFLYQATKNPFYLHVGKDVLESLNKHTKVKCGHATVHSVDDMSLEDRQESFFLSETCKYLFLLFDVGNPVNQKEALRYIFTTEGHLFPVSHVFRNQGVDQANTSLQLLLSLDDDDGDDMLPTTDEWKLEPNDLVCQTPGPASILPLKSRYLEQLFTEMGVSL